MKRYGAVEYYNDLRPRRTLSNAPWRRRFAMFAVKAQDRAIRAEENLRHFSLTGKLLDPRLTIRQIIALRFAPDGEFVSLAQAAVDKNLAEDAIKQAVKKWRSDTYRV